jgi:hypothetical protein
MTITVLPNQNVLDVAIQHTGSVLNAFNIALANGLCVSDVLVVNQILILPETNQDISVFNNYKKNKIEPATSITKLEIVPQKRGIGFMKVGSSLIVDKDE